MFKKALSICTAALGIGMLAGSLSVSKADDFEGYCYTGPGVYNLYTYMSGYKDPSGNISGWAYFATPDGGWMWSNYYNLSVIDQHNADGWTWGYFKGSKLALTHVMMRNDQLSLQIVDTSGNILESVPAGWVLKGALAAHGSGATSGTP